MKYFRTKNGYIIDMVEAAPYIKDPKKSKDLRIFLDSYGYGEIIKEADTIEELCDGLIVEENGNESNWFFMSIDDFQLLSYDHRQYQWNGWTFKAFVKTDKGFIYVAQMNKNGVLKLL